jgi:predicted transcriptional regulator
VPLSVLVGALASKQSLVARFGLVSYTHWAAAEGVREPVPINKSVRPDHIVCLFDGKKFKSLRRHLRSEHHMTPEEYRETFGLRRDYPMVASAYAKRRSELAKAIGLGQKRRKSSAKSATKPATPTKAKRAKKG